MSNISKKLNSWAPEYFTRRIYEKLTEVRVLIFWLLVLLYIIDSLFIKPDLMPYWFSNWGPEIFTGIATKMLYLLLTIGVFTATFFTIVIETIRNKNNSTTVTGIWTNLVEYTIYPFAASIIIGMALFFIKIGVNIPALFFSFLIVHIFNIEFFLYDYKNGGDIDK